MSRESAGAASGPAGVRGWSLAKTGGSHRGQRDGVELIHLFVGTKSLPSLRVTEGVTLRSSSMSTLAAMKAA